MVQIKVFMLCIQMVLCLNNENTLSPDFIPLVYSVTKQCPETARVSQIHLSVMAIKKGTISSLIKANSLSTHADVSNPFHVKSYPPKT